MGSKARIAKYIVPILQECIDSNNVNTYIEPFVGGANIIDKIKCKNRVGGGQPQKIDFNVARTSKRLVST